MGAVHRRGERHLVEVPQLVPAEDNAPVLHRLGGDVLVAVLLHVVEERPPLHSKPQLPVGVLHQHAHGDGSPLRCLPLDEVFQQDKNLTDLAWTAGEREEVFGVVLETVLVLGHRPVSHTHHGRDVRVRDANRLPVDEERVDLLDPAQRPECPVAKEVQKGDHQLLLVLGHVVGQREGGLSWLRPLAHLVRVDTLSSPFSTDHDNNEQSILCVFSTAQRRATVLYRGLPPLSKGVASPRFFNKKLTGG